MRRGLDFKCVMENGEIFQGDFSGNTWVPIGFG